MARWRFSMRFVCRCLESLWLRRRELSWCMNRRLMQTRRVDGSCLQIGKRDETDIFTTHHCNVFGSAFAGQESSSPVVDNGRLHRPADCSLFVCEHTWSDDSAIALDARGGHRCPGALLRASSYQCQLHEWASIEATAQELFEGDCSYRAGYRSHCPRRLWSKQSAFVVTSCNRVSLPADRRDCPTPRDSTLDCGKQQRAIVP